MRYEIIKREYGRVTLLDIKTWFEFEIREKELFNYL